VKGADKDTDARVRDSFARQTMMTTLGARVAAVGPGEVEIVLPFSA
jgi:acyl-coenzyme A thioesterase PaaI-like protein